MEWLKAALAYGGAQCGKTTQYARGGIEAMLGAGGARALRVCRLPDLRDVLEEVHDDR